MAENSSVEPLISSSESEDEHPPDEPLLSKTISNLRVLNQRLIKEIQELRTAKEDDVPSPLVEELTQALEEVTEMNKELRQVTVPTKESLEKANYRINILVRALDEYATGTPLGQLINWDIGRASRPVSDIAFNPSGILSTLTPQVVLNTSNTYVILQGVRRGDYDRFMSKKDPEEPNTNYAAPCWWTVVTVTKDPGQPWKKKILESGDMIMWMPLKLIQLILERHKSTVVWSLSQTKRWGENTWWGYYSFSPQIVFQKDDFRTSCYDYSYVEKVKDSSGELVDNQVVKHIAHQESGITSLRRFIKALMEEYKPPTFVLKAFENYPSPQQATYQELVDLIYDSPYRIYQIRKNCPNQQPVEPYPIFLRRLALAELWYRVVKPWQANIQVDINLFVDVMAWVLKLNDHVVLTDDAFDYFLQILDDLLVHIESCGSLKN